MCQNVHNVVRKAYRKLGKKWEMGQESESRNVRCAQNMTEGLGKAIAVKVAEVKNL
jgi:hypothetical protein